MKKISLLITLILCLNVCCLKAQTKGFLGKTNEVSLDLFSIAYAGIYSLQYKKVLNSHLSLSLSYGKIFKGGDLYYDYDFILFPNTTSRVANDIKVRGHNWSVIMNFSTPLTGMDMPFGNYFGIGIEHLSSNTTYQNPNKPKLYSYYNNSNPYDSIVSVKNNQNRLVLVLGRDSYIANNITFDFNLQFGFEIGSLKSNENIDESIVFPRRGEIFGSGVDSYHYFFLYPQLKLGYIF